MASSSPKLLACLVAAALALAAIVVVSPSAAQNSPQDYVDSHNAVRADVGLSPVSWDDTMAAYAQSYAT
jgi:pathogenesis-related protein 1